MIFRNKSYDKTYAVQLAPPENGNCPLIGHYSHAQVKFDEYLCKAKATKSLIKMSFYFLMAAREIGRMKRGK